LPFRQQAVGFPTACCFLRCIAGAACFAGLGAADHARWQTATPQMEQLFKKDMS
jgi:hypothetical protein